MCRVLGLCSDPAVTDVASFTTEVSEPLLHLGEVGVSSILDPKERTQVKPRCASQRLLPFVPPKIASRAGLSNASGRVAFSRSRRHSSVESRCEGPGSITGGRGEPSSVKAAVTKLRPFTPQNSDPASGYSPRAPRGTSVTIRAVPRLRGPIVAGAVRPCPRRAKGADHQFIRPTDQNDGSFSAI